MASGGNIVTGDREAVRGEQPSDAAIEYAREHLYSAVIADTLDSIGLHDQILQPGIRPLDDDLILCGRARVGLYMPLYHDDETTKVYEIELNLIDDLRPNDVPVLVCHGNVGIAPWGELLTTRAMYLHAAGCLTDGSVRDIRLIRRMKFPVFSGGTNPSDTKHRGKLMMYDVPGRIGGVRIVSGDVVFGDVDGIVVIPREVAEEVVAKAAKKVSGENTVRDELSRGESLNGVFKRYGIL